MFVPVPGGPDQPPPRPTEPDLEPIPALTSWRPRGKWPALLRLSWLCRLLAFLSLVSAFIMAIVGLAIAGQGQALGLLYSVMSIVSGMIAFIFWMGLAEAILLAISIEKNARLLRANFAGIHTVIRSQENAIRASKEEQDTKAADILLGRDDRPSS